MKPNRTFFLMVLFLATGPASFAQKPIRISEDSISFGNAKYPGIIVCIPEVGYDRTLKSWIKELQSGTKSNVVTENGNMSIFGAMIKDVSPNPINVYSKLVNQDSMMSLMVSMELKKDQYICKVNGETELNAAREHLRQFAKEQYVDLVKDQVQAEEKKLGNLKDDLSKLQNEKSRMQKSIESNKTDISSAKDNITLLNNQLTNLNAEILTQNNQLSTMEAGAAKDEKASYLKDLEKRKKKMQNEIESSQNKINKAETEISDANQAIPRNESEQDVARNKIAQQEDVVKKFTEKLNTVKAF
jgi:peptidoglycan hydrolase CwlO-like protein